MVDVVRHKRIKCCNFFLFGQLRVWLAQMVAYTGFGWLLSTIIAADDRR
jgi:hypothetical protein